MLRTLSLRLAVCGTVVLGACSGASETVDEVATSSSTSTIATTTTTTTTTTLDPNLDPYYPELGNPWGIDSEAAITAGVEVALFCLLVAGYDTLPDPLPSAEVKDSAERLEGVRYGSAEDRSALQPYLDGLYTIIEQWREAYPERPGGVPISVISDEVARANLFGFELSPACKDTNFQAWLNSKEMNTRAKELLGVD